MKIKEIEVGSEGPSYVLIKKIEQAKDRNGSPYVILDIYDGSVEVKAKIWSCEKETLEAKKLIEGEVANIVLQVSEYNGRSNYVISKIRHPEKTEYNMNDFKDLPPVEGEELFDRCIKIAESVEHKGYRSLLMLILNENKDKLQFQGAAQLCHHNTISGLIWHMYRTTEVVDGLAKVYPSINRSLAITGAMLHDIGKIEEMETDNIGNTTYTKKGQLFSHSLLGYEIVREYNKKLEKIAADESVKNNEEPVNESLTDEELDNLLHIIISHHGTLEFGSIKEPATLEAYVVHMADDMDSKVYIHEKYREKTLGKGEFSEKKDYFLGTRVYNPDMENNADSPKTEEKNNPDA